MKQKDLYKFLRVAGIFIGIVGGIVMTYIILFGNPIYPINQNYFKSNLTFDLSVLSVFVGLILIAVGWD